MKYKITEINSYGNDELIIQVQVSDNEYTGFIAIPDSLDYDVFLEQTGLTDEQVRALPVDEWIEL